MNRVEFERVYDRIITKQASLLCEAYKEEGLIFRGNKDEIFEKYKKLHEDFRALLRKPKDEHFDRHKLCACLTVAIIEAFPLSTEEINNPETYQKIRLSTVIRPNEQLAFTSAVLLLFSVVREQAQKTKAPELQEVFKMPVNIPKSSRGRNDALSDLISSLFYARLDRSLSLPLLSALYFYIESYHAKAVDVSERQLAEY